MTARSEPLRCADAPCRSCPYRRDVPSGVWARAEYDRLPDYDRPTGEQPPGLFMCHQADGCLCAGWLACHGAGELLAVRLAHRRLNPRVWSYKSPVAVFVSGAEARAHGIADLERPGRAAVRTIERLECKRDARRAT